MRNSALLLIFSLIISACSCNKNDTEQKTTTIKVPLADPFILLYDNVYYAYGTFAENGIAVFTSDDLINWSVPREAVNGLALNKNDVWGDRWFWAPEVYHINGTFYMYFSADEHICVATSNHPLGPFKQEVKKPIIENEKCIDNSLVFDNGIPYMLFNRFNDGIVIWIAEMEDNLMEIKPETMVQCIHVSQPWEEIWPRVNEGGFIVKHNNTFYLSYSANSYESQFYGVGFATATAITGPWTKYSGNPILQKPGSLVGVGHSAMFTDKEGQLRIVFHAHNNNEHIHPRHMYISSVSFETTGNEEIMVIDPNYLTPLLKVN